MSSTKNLGKLVIIGGISGAGSSTALKAFEDFQFSAIGRIPVSLIKEFIKTRKENSRVAILAEIKSQQSLNELLAVISELGREEIDIIFLDASDDAIIKRYSETRRPHPDFASKEDKTLVDAIRRERNNLIKLKEISNLCIDTSNLTVHDLKRQVSLYIENHYNLENSIRVNLVSFGFKNGIPLDCDLIADVRFLSNPNYIDQLKNLTGLDAELSKWVLEKEDTKKFLALYSDLLKFLIPKYAFEGKSYLNIGIGCTGGKHRSVAISEALSREISLPKHKITCYHRDIHN
ncbi:MAG: RNase adapter RapZ [bacterium]|nr:RNase adapter RapZ [bacterium]